LARHGLNLAHNIAGLLYKDIEEGTGVVPQPGQKIKAHCKYTLCAAYLAASRTHSPWGRTRALTDSGYLLETGKKFDSSYDRGKPLPFAVGTGQVIRGWDEGLLTMKVGGKRMLVIPAKLAYGSKPVGGGLIPANSDLVFYVELVTIAA
jgi:peptidylprolyl isomerase